MAGDSLRDPLQRPDVSRTPVMPTKTSRRAVVAASTPGTAPAAPAVKRDRTHYLYIAVIVAVALGIAVGLIWPDAGGGAQAARHRAS